MMGVFIFSNFKWGLGEHVLGEITRCIMEEIENVGGTLQLPPPKPLVIAIAITGNRKSKYVVKWALEKFASEGKLMFKLLHVRPKILTVPTPMGNTIPISQVREDIVTAFKKEVEWKANEKLLPYKKMCAQRKVQVEVVQIESNDVVKAIAEEVTKCTINKLVIGATSHSIFSRGRNLSSTISSSTPSFCTVYAISKGKLLSIRPSDLETNGSTKDDCSETSSSTTNSSSQAQSSEKEWTDSGSTASCTHFRHASLPMQRFEALATINHNFHHVQSDSLGARNGAFISSDSWERGKSSFPYYSTIDPAKSRASSLRSLETDNQTWTSEQASTSDSPTDFPSKSQDDITFELEKLRVELRHVRGMYAVAQSETFDASRKLSDLHKRRLEESNKLKEINLKAEEAKELAQKENKKYDATKREVEYVKECTEMEAAQRKEAEKKALNESKEKEKLETAITGTVKQYQEFTWEEIVSATSSFSEDLKIGMGAYGTVYRSSFHHTVAAVKVLHSPEARRTKQFHQELEVLSKIRHPHLLILLGACPDRGCLVYEYMENGSLEERLFRINNTPSIPWFERFRIAWEIASALVFLHHAKPKSIIHRDLKPANILLDKKFVSKIGDVGLSMMLQPNASYISSMYKDTGPVGTLCYIDPEYQRSGAISPSSDVYAFGMVIMQLLTAKPAIALAHMVETAVEDGQLVKILDPHAGEWPVEETKELAMLGLKCAEIRRRDRPALKDEVVPVLEKLKEVADRARDLASSSKRVPLNHFICPILKEVMEDPCVASDGYTYDRKAILIWFENNDKSPVTNLPLLNKSLIPNYPLLSAIMEWKSRKE